MSTAKSFINETVTELYRKYGTELSDVKIVLPGKRSRIFFDKETASLLGDAPIWQPEYLSVDMIAKRITGLEKGEQLKLLVELYSVYAKYHKDSFDRFYQWGGMLLADFDSIDNYMVDASKLFVNITDIKEIEARFDYLSDAERELVERFWSSVAGGVSGQKKAFLEVWRTLETIYNEFKERLAKLGIGYTGMIYRAAAEHLQQGGELPQEYIDSRWAVVGFNALSRAEKIIFSAIRKDAKETLFFWDADNYYLKDTTQEAGLFMRENISAFGDDASSFSRDNFASPKKINIVNSPSDALQCRYVTEFLNECLAEHASKGTRLGTETVIVLTDENLLLPVLYSIPEQIPILNVTGGYLLKGSAVHALCERIISLRANMKNNDGMPSFYHKDVLWIVSHPFVKKQLSQQETERLDRLADEIVDDSIGYVDYDMVVGENSDTIMQLLFSKQAVESEVTEHIGGVLESVLKECEGDPVTGQMIYKTLEAIAELSESLAECRQQHPDIDLSAKVVLSLLRRHLSSVKMSFEGEPLMGLQVMGILETRNIDFENVLILSVGEDSFPGKGSGDSYIPASLRTGYGMPSSGYHEAMYSYYFYRLLQRARRVDIVYNSSSDGISTGEPSRFIRQLEIESPHRHEIEHLNISLNVGLLRNEREAKVKDEAVMNVLKNFTDGKRRFSPSSIYTYIRCPYKFYLSYVEGVRSLDSVDEEMDEKTLGSIFHDSLEQIYSDASSLADGVSLLRRVAADKKRISDYVRTALENHYNRKGETLAATVRMKVRFIEGYVKAILDYDLSVSDNSSCGLSVVGLECPVEMSFALKDGRKVTIYGRIDRVDRFDTKGVRVVDYKSGGRYKAGIKTVSELFEVRSPKYMLPPFQSMLYALMWRKMNGGEVRPALYYARSMNDPSYEADVVIDKQAVHSISEYEEEFLQELERVVEEILSVETPFLRCDSESDNCSMCEYKSICG